MSILKKRQKSEHYENRKNKHQQLDNEQISSSTNLQECLICNRRFTENRLIAHKQVCEQSKKLHSNSSYRYHYDSPLHRWKGLDYYIKTSQSNAKYHKLQSLTQHFPKTYWREKHQQFQDVVKEYSNPTKDFIQSSNDRPYQCSQCQRKFATENAITKHQKGCTSKRQMNIKSRNIKNK